MTKQIPLTQGKVALVDDDMYDFLMQWKWSAHCPRGGNWYAIRNDRTGLRKKLIRMHRVILNAPDEVNVDHRDGDGLHNERHNLRLCTQAQNTFNSGLRNNNTTGFKGVSPCRGKYRAVLNISKQQIHIGVFITAEEAARAYDEKARELFGEFARTNF